MSPTRRAFTLIELLVVISIIALLLTILLPSLKSAYEAGQSAVCMANMDSIFAGAFLHAQDNEDYLPHFAYYASVGPSGEWWVTQVAQAIDQFERDIYACPADASPHIGTTFYYTGSTISMNPPGGNLSAPQTLFPVEYRGHCDLVWDPPYTTALEPRKFLDWMRPEVAIMMLETRAHPLSNTGVCFDLDHLIPLQDPTFRHTRHEEFERHMGQSNVLFIDGHVDSLVATEVGRLAANAEIVANGTW